MGRRGDEIWYKETIIEKGAGGPDIGEADGEEQGTGAAGVGMADEPAEGGL